MEKKLKDEKDISEEEEKAWDAAKNAYGLSE